MKTLYIDCGMGVAGDMLGAALYELLSESKKARFLEIMNGLGVPGLFYSAGRLSRCGISGTTMSVLLDGRDEEDVMKERAAKEGEDGTGCTDSYRHEDSSCHDHIHEANALGHHHGNHNHSHRSMREVAQILEGMRVADRVKARARKVYDLIAEAESFVHEVPITEIHFHEVGSLDAIADVTAACLLLDMLAPDRVVCSPVRVGHGQVHCAHGILPVPAPATARLLLGIPSYGGDKEGEMCTPTGVALVKELADAFAPQPLLKSETIGYGMGKKDFGWAGCVRAIMGEEEDPEKYGLD